MIDEWRLALELRAEVNYRTLNILKNFKFFCCFCVIKIDISLLRSEHFIQA